MLKQLADQAVADQVDAIIPIATTAAQVSAVAAEDSRTPVVYAAISDPDTAKLTGIDYVTGTSDALNTEYILDMMLAQDPGVSRWGCCTPVRAQLHQAHCRGQGVSGAARHYLCGADCQHQRRGGGRCRRPDLRQGGRRVHPTDNVIMAAELAIADDLAKAGIPTIPGLTPLSATVPSPPAASTTPSWAHALPRWPIRP